MSVNSRLFTVCGSPVKIFLEGFIYLDVLRATKLIIKHGGTAVSKPDGRTVVLSPSTSHSSVKCARFRINWLYDCVARNELLDIIKYILPPKRDRDRISEVSQIECREAQRKDQSKIHHVIDKNEDEEAENHCNASVVPSSSKNTVIPDTTGSSMSDTPKPPGEIVNNEDLASNAEPSNYSPEASDANDHSSSDSNSTSDSLSDDSDSSDSTSGEAERHNYIKHSQVFSRNKESSSISRETGCFDSNSDSDVEPKVKKRKREVLVRATHSGEKRYSDSPKFSKEEDQRIVNYLIENNAIDESCRRPIWTKCKAEGEFIRPYRSVESLQNHVCQFLRYNYRNYTDDLIVLREFEKLNEAMHTAASNKYTEEEKKQMIQYLIDKRAIRKACELKTWKEMKDDGIFQNHRRRSAAALRYYFNTQMHETFKDYTKDAEALKEFKRYFKKLRLKK